MQYPIPSYACTLWQAGGDLMVTIPGQGPEARSHTLKFPATTAGIRTILTILKDRQAQPKARLAERGQPTQWLVENDKRYKAWLRAMGEGKRKAAADLAEAMALLDELGL